MIGKVVRGEDVAGLLRYLFGPGRHAEHVDAHLVGSWDGVPEAIEPPARADGRRNTAGLARFLCAPLVLRDTPPPKWVWHCSLRVAPEDRRLTDAEWCRVAEDVMHRTGIAPDGDDGACRWVAVRHAEDHVHLVAVLARQDGRSVRVWRDYPRVREACRAAELRYRMRRTAPAGRVAAASPTQAEMDKADRAGRAEPARQTLRREVRLAAIEADGQDGFLAALRVRGVRVTTRTDAAGTLTGYAVALPDDLGRDGEPVYFGGRKLVPDLSAPRLLDRWASTPPATVPGGRDRAAVFSAAAVAAHEATTRIRAGDADADGIVHAAGDLLAVAARSIEPRMRGQVTAAADAFDAATRQAWRPVPPPGPTGTQLRLLARSLRTIPHAGRPEQDSAAALVAALLWLVVAVARYHAVQRRTYATRAALAAADHLRRYQTPQTYAPAGPAAVPRRQRAPVHGRGR